MLELSQFDNVAFTRVSCERRGWDIWLKGIGVNSVGVTPIPYIIEQGLFMISGVSYVFTRVPLPLL